jgi:hypothetical protein
MATNRAKARAMATKKAKAGTIATEQDITDQRDSDIEVLDDKIREAIAMKNGLAIGDPRRLELSDAINQRMESRTDLAIRELKAGLDSAQLAAAMAKITTASQDLKTEAAKMQSITSFLNNTNAVIGAATKITNIVKNGG